jgi:hypothetical protein
MAPASHAVRRMPLDVCPRPATAGYASQDGRPKWRANLPVWCNDGQSCGPTGLALIRPVRWGDDGPGRITDLPLTREAVNISR